MQGGARRVPQQQRSQARVGAILDAAAAEFAESGYTAATTAVIAKRAGVPIGSLYQYFPDKEALLYGLSQRHIADGSDVLLAALDRAALAPDLEGAVRELVEATVEANSGDPRLHRLLYLEAPRPPAVQEQLQHLEDAVAAWVARELVRRGACTRADAPLRARSLVVTVEALVHDVLISPLPRVSRRRAVDEVVRVAVAAARA